MQCSSCGEDVVASSRYCPACGARVAGSQAETLTGAHGDRPPTSGALDGARFIPGTLLAGRYRIVGLLGRGGMGEVYRADDLKLAQPVALKFLPSDVNLRPDRLDRFLQEVRLARQVSHPNVCRVHDIGETNGQHFLSMEYFDGEDLASLLRRIGRLPSDKALELARQLCAGLAAAHARNVLHRDLKPANVLIDGRGVAHLVDFGLADLANQRREVHEIAGTLGYMAPEQLEGRAATTRTDIYALGLVLYEMFTGQRALTADTAAIGGRAPVAMPPRPSSHLPDLDPAIERVILRCLEPDPARRPASAHAVAAALPGGNRLTAVLAAGETPSPDMVAAAGEAGTLSPPIGALCFGAVVAGLLLLSVVMRNVNLIGLTNIDRGPQFFVERAHTALRNLGYPDPPSDEAFGFTSDTDYLRHLDESDPSPTRWRALATPQPPALLFWYRQSPRQLVPIGGTNFVTRQNPPDSRSGMASLTLDQTGRLASLLAIPVQLEKRPQGATAAASAPNIDWAPLFAEAGLSMAQFSPADPQWIPPVFADTRQAWQGAYPGRPDVPIRIEAAAAMGRPVYFEIVAPWTRPRNEDTGFANTSGDRVVLRMRTVVTPLMIVITSALAIYNLRLGRGDRRGAIRLSLFILCAGLLSDGLASGDLTFITRGQPLTVFLALMVWVLYLALEPHLRRTWPDTMIGWSRLLSGAVRDPLVGRDLLIGVLVAIGNALILTLHIWLRQWSGRPPQFPLGAAGNPFDGVAATSDLLLGGRMALSRVAGSVLSIPVWMGTMLAFLLLFVLLMLLRKRSLAMAALVAGLTAVYVLSHGGWLLANAPADHFPPGILDVSIFAAVQAGVVFVAVRFGLLTMLVAAFVSQLILLLPIVINSPAPYAASSRLIVATVLALAAYGWYTSLAGRPMFGVLFAPTAPSRHS